MPKPTYSRTTINVQGEDQEVFEVYADESREQTIAFCFNEEDACRIATWPGLLEALEKIAKGEGAFSADQLQHAGNTIDNMKSIALAAIALAKP